MSMLLQVRYRGTSIAIHIVGQETPEVLRYVARFAAFQAETMEQNPSSGELEYASWMQAAPASPPMDRPTQGDMNGR